MHCVNDMDNKCKVTLVYLIAIFRYDTISSSLLGITFILYLLKLSAGNGYWEFDVVLR